ncbi:UxaA family hydrolase [Fluviibacterium sp. DFM31]|uniref:UxaA family hydrolase n=1 Tax=Meridianimarinicoccus marinus TaxID=3231483 RepID=A0ABV3L7T8_9RHOB
MSDQTGMVAGGLLHLHPADNVVVAIRAITEGESIKVGGTRLVAPRDLGLGHKLALTAIAEGEDVTKYGAPIGRASRDIAPGEHVHLHNLASRYTVIEDIEGTNA